MEISPSLRLRTDGEPFGKLRIPRRIPSNVEGQCRTIRVGIRPSPLALKQAEEALPILKKLYPEASLSIYRILTCGDKDKLTPLSQVEGSNFFTKEIDEALLSAEVDVAVHSSKDLPDILPDGLVVLFETKSVSPYDALVSRDNLKFRQLPSGGRIGASSLRRKDEIRALRPDLEIVDVRGNIQERLFLIKQDKVDAVVVAHAALIRLGLEDRISEVFPLSIFQTHPKQGCLSIVVRRREIQ